MNYSKLLISGDLELLSGLHIGGSDAYSAIGAIDSRTVIDPLSKLPMIPGSSLKGKLRALLAKKYNDKPVDNHSNDAAPILRLFGSASSDSLEELQTSRILVSDLVMKEEEEERILNLGAEAVTEVKYENTINRLTSVAMPRQIERVIKGVIFPMEIIYELSDINEAEEDLQLLKEGFDLLRYDYLGGHGSRGYGRVSFNNMSITPLTDIDSDVDNLINKLKEKWSYD